MTKDTVEKFLIFACALHNAEHQIDMIAWCRPNGQKDSFCGIAL